LFQFKNDFYSADAFLPTKREKFDAWFAQNRDKPFNLVENLREYGCNDVKLLAHAAVKYRELVREISGNPYEDVFYSCCTLASSTLRDLRMNHLKEKTVAIIPHMGYCKNENQSQIALKYLKWWANVHAKNVLHRDNGGEKTLVFQFSM
jgi:hypothetical protein